MDSVEITFNGHARIQARHSVQVLESIVGTELFSSNVRGVESPCTLLHASKHSSEQIEELHTSLLTSIVESPNYWRIVIIASNTSFYRSSAQA